MTARRFTRPTAVHSTRSIIRHLTHRRARDRTPARPRTSAKLGLGLAVLAALLHAGCGNADRPAGGTPEAASSAASELVQSAPPHPASPHQHPWSGDHARSRLVPLAELRAEVAGGDGSNGEADALADAESTDPNGDDRRDRAEARRSTRTSSARRARLSRSATRRRSARQRRPDASSSCGEGNGGALAGDCRSGRDGNGDTSDVEGVENRALAAALAEPPLQASDHSSGDAKRAGWGLSDEQARSFLDPRFRDLEGVKLARVIVPWDLMTRGGRHAGVERAMLAEWMESARAAGLDPTVSFQRSRAAPDVLPSPSAYAAAVRAFRDAHPQVRWYTAWNEPNHGLQPTHTRPRRAGEYWSILQSQCDADRRNPCAVAAGDFVDAGSLIRSGYVERYRGGMGRWPRLWAWHAYSAGRRRSSRSLQAFLEATSCSSCPRSMVWLTEQGGLVSERKRKTRQSPEKADADLRYLLSLPNLSERITRFYVYHWKGDSNWDSGLIDERTNRPRPAYDTFREQTSAD